MQQSGERLKIALATLAIAFALPMFAQAETDDGLAVERGPEESPRYGRRGPDPGHFLDRHADELGLDAGVRESIQAIVDASRLQAEKIRKEIRGEYEAMRGLLSQSSPDEAAVMQQSDRIEALRTEQRKNRLEAMLAIRKLLTPEQREQLVAMREEGRSGFGGPGTGDRFGKRHRGPLAGCREDVATLCSESEPGRPRLKCLDAEWENLSDGCRAAFEGRGRRGPRPEGNPDFGPE